VEICGSRVAERDLRNNWNTWKNCGSFVWRQLRHRAVSLSQHGFLVLILIRRVYADIRLHGVTCRYVRPTKEMLLLCLEHESEILSPLPVLCKQNWTGIRGRSQEVETCRWRNIFFELSFTMISAESGVKIVQQTPIPNVRSADPADPQDLRHRHSHYSLQNIPQWSEQKLEAHIQASHVNITVTVTPHSLIKMQTTDVAADWTPTSRHSEASLPGSSCWVNAALLLLSAWHPPLRSAYHSHSLMMFSTSKRVALPTSRFRLTAAATHSQMFHMLCNNEVA